jgi:hypothetical protein
MHAVVLVLGTAAVKMATSGGARPADDGIAIVCPGKARQWPLAVAGVGSGRVCSKATQRADIAAVF